MSRITWNWDHSPYFVNDHGDEGDFDPQAGENPLEIASSGRASGMARHLLNGANSPEAIMEGIRIKGIKRIIIPAALQPGGGTGEAITIKSKGRKRKKQSKAYRFQEKLTRRAMRSGSSIFDGYLARHNRSNRKKKNGWMKDLGKNLSNSVRKGRKKFKLSTLF